jgi:hypothetical protein
MSRILWVGLTSAVVLATMFGVWVISHGARSELPAWKIDAGENARSLRIESNAMTGTTTINGRCDATGVVFIVHYHGTGLTITDEYKQPLKNDDLRRPLNFVVKNHGMIRTYWTTAHYGTPDTWIVDELPVTFMDKLAASETLMVQAKNWQTIGEFSTTGIKNAYEIMKSVCWK